MTAGQAVVFAPVWWWGRLWCLLLCGGGAVCGVCSCAVVGLSGTDVFIFPSHLAVCVSGVPGLYHFRSLLACFVIALQIE